MTKRMNMRRTLEIMLSGKIVASFDKKGRLTLYRVDEYGTFMEEGPDGWRNCRKIPDWSAMMEYVM